MESVHGRIRIDEDENDTHDLMSYPQHEQTMGEPSLHTESDHRQLRSEVKKVPLPQPQLRHLNLLAVRGIHYVEYAIGKPSQKVRLALSLNSDYAIFRCSQYDCPNNNCGVPTFNRFQSNTFDQIGCDSCSFGGVCTNDRCVTQGEEWTSYLARDYILTEEGSFDLKFGCQTAANGFFETIETSANGILGLSVAPTSFINQMYRAEMISTTSFSLCFERYNGQNLANAGTLTIGGYKSDFLTSPMVYLENSGKQGKYTTFISNIYLRDGGGESVSPDDSRQRVTKLIFDKTAANFGAGTVIDTTYPGTLLNFSIGNSFRSEWKKMTGKTYTTDPISLTPTELLGLPTVLVQLRSSTSSNQFTDPDTVVGMVGTNLDPQSPFDVLLAIPATHYMHRQNNGSYKTMLSIDHNNGSVLGSNVFQGRHILFRTGYSSVNTYIGIAEAAKCSEAPPVFVDVESGVSTTSPTISTSQGTSPPSLSPNESANANNPNKLVEKSGLVLWPIFVGTGLFVAALAVGLTICCMKRSQKKKKRAETAEIFFESVVAPSNDDDGSSLVSYGLRSHLFSVKSSRGVNGGETSAETRSSEENRRPGRKRQIANTGAMDEESAFVAKFGAMGKESALATNAPPRNSIGHASNGSSSSNRNNSLTQPILAHAAPIGSSYHEPVRAEPVNSYPNTQHNQGISQEYVRPGQPSLRPNMNNKPFLVDKETDSSDDEHRTQSRKSRKHARRQLELATGESRASKSRAPNVENNGRSGRDYNARDRGGARPTDFDDREPRRESTAMGSTDFDDRKPRRESMAMGGTGFDDREPRRQTMAMGSTDFDDRSRMPRPQTRSDLSQMGGTGFDDREPRRQTMTMGRTDFNDRSRMPRPQTRSDLSQMGGTGFDDSEPRRQTMAMGRTNSDDRKPRRESMAMGGTGFDDREPRRQTTAMGRTDSDDRSRMQRPQSRADLSQMGRPGKLSRASSRSDGKSLSSKRSSKAETLANAARRSTMEFSRHSTEKNPRPPTQDHYPPPGRSRKVEGTVVGGMNDDVSYLSGFTNVKQSNQSKMMSNSRKGSIGDKSLGRSNHSIGIGNTLRGRNSVDSSMHGRSVNGDGPEDPYRKKSLAFSELSESDHSRRHSQNSSGSGRRRSGETIGNSQHSRGTNEDYQYQRGGNEMGYSGSGGASIAQSTRSRRNSGRRPSTLGSIKEDPSRRTTSNQIPRGPPSTRDTRDKPKKMLPRNRESVESFARYRMDSEMRSRNLPAAPQYRVMPAGNSSMW